MKNFSAPKLLKLALTGTHLPSCPHIKDKLPGYECLCWKNEVQKWAARLKTVTSNRTRKPYLQKIHLFNHKCSAKNPLVTSSDLSKITCQQCLKFANKPIKITNPRRGKKITLLAQNSSTTIITNP